MLEFAGNKYIYLPKIKKDKIRKIRESEKDNESEAPILMAQKNENKMDIEKDEIFQKIKKYGPQDSKPKDESNMSDSSDDAYLKVNFKDFNIDLENSQINPLQESNQNAAPNINFKKAIDTNACVIRYKALQKPEINVTRLYKCSKCQAYLNKFSNPKRILKMEIMNGLVNFVQI